MSSSSSAQALPAGTITILSGMGKSVDFATLSGLNFRPRLFDVEAPTKWRIRAECDACMEGWMNEAIIAYSINCFEAACV